MVPLPSTTTGGVRMAARAPSTLDEIEVRKRVRAALEARDSARRRFDASVGTGTEMRAYTRLRAAAAHLAALDNAGRG
jgi:hypothetical protein